MLRSEHQESQGRREKHSLRNRARKSVREGITWTQNSIPSKNITQRSTARISKRKTEATSSMTMVKTSSLMTVMSRKMARETVKLVTKMMMPIR